MPFVNTVDVIGDETLLGKILDRSITEVADNISTKIGDYTFLYCDKLATVDFQIATSIGGVAFQFCTSLTKANFPMVTSIGGSSFANCTAMTALILRSETVCTMQDKSALSSSGIAIGRGYIYVPAALVDTYKAATNWSTHAARFRALEDYTVDGTISGELDPNKI